MVIPCHASAKQLRSQESQQVQAVGRAGRAVAGERSRILIPPVW